MIIRYNIPQPVSNKFYEDINIDFMQNRKIQNTLQKDWAVRNKKNWCLKYHHFLFLLKQGTKFKVNS